MSRRAAARYVLIEHQQTATSGCHCGWGDDPRHLGLSWAEHVCDELAAVGLVEVGKP